MKRTSLAGMAARFAAIAAFVLGATAHAQEAQIRKNLPKLLPEFPAIEEVRTTPIPGIYELRVDGSDLYYTDAQGRFLIQGDLLDLKDKRNLTKERESQLSTIAFKSLPFDDAFTIQRGNGSRQLAMFSDPNCGYCKRIERELMKFDDITIHVFLYPVLGPDSVVKARAVWCAKDKGQVWLDWMLKSTPPPAAQGPCDTNALERNRAFGRQHKINGTPTLFFADGSRVPGAIDAVQLEKQFAAIPR